jgi:hypothetical protein
VKARDDVIPRTLARVAAASTMVTSTLSDTRCIPRIER